MEDSKSAPYMALHPIITTENLKSYKYSQYPLSVPIYILTSFTTEHVTSRRMPLSMMRVATWNSKGMKSGDYGGQFYGHRRKYSLEQFLYCCVRIRCHGNVFTELSPTTAVSSGSTIQAFSRHVTI
jgi:hypothetical protein